jgi:SAM-dependent methyltransferase
MKEHAQMQAEYFDSAVDADYEIRRPHGTPRFHRWLLEEKFRRSVAGLHVDGASALVVCGGSGMDAELLARAGARVTVTDISPGAIARARERGRRFGVTFETEVADASSLPYADGSFDIAYVHDGLHHLEDPERALREMARVADRAVSVTEPARAAITRFAVQLGIAGNREDAGNVVARLDPSRVADVLRDCGFEPVRVARYPMFYRHRAGLPMRVFSVPLFYPLAILAMRAAGRVLGRVGNKMVVTAVRPDSRASTVEGGAASV